MRKLTLLLVLVFALLSEVRLGIAQDSASDDALTKNLLSSSGPTFQVDAKESWKELVNHCLRRHALY